MILPLLLSLIIAAGMPDPQRIAVVGATVIDGTGGAPLRDGVVLITGKRITAVGARSAVPIPEGARQIDASGKWLIPGLIDLHVHLDEDITPGAYPLFGVTSVRDVGSRLITLQKLRARAAKGGTLPRLYWMGRNIDEGKPSWWGAVAVKGAAEVPALLDDMQRQGVDGVKLYVAAGPEVARAVIKDAHRRGWPVTGHLGATSPLQAARAGIDNLEHASTLVHSLKPKTATANPGYLGSFTGAGAVALSSPESKRLIAALARQHVAVTPTLVSSTMPVEGEASARRIYSGWVALPAGWAADWKRDYWSFISPKGWSKADYREARAAFAKYKAMVRALRKAGVAIVAGTDTPAPWVLPGAGLVRELELLTEAGLSPSEALQAATGRAANVLRKSKDVGTVRPGRLADFVLLDADPLRDIRNLRRVDAVYMSGQEIDLGRLRKEFWKAKTPVGK